METFQQEIVRYDPQMKDFLVPVKKAHITLLVFRVPEGEMDEAKEVFNRVIKEKIVSQFVKSDMFEVNFEGVGSFDQKVVFIKPVTGLEWMRYMNTELFNGFTDAGLVCDTVFTPHVTMFKGKKGNKIGKIPAKCLEMYGEKYFGTQTIFGIQLLSMSKPLTEEGYYFCEEKFEFEQNTWEKNE